jgi:hypothetical protein
MELKQSINRLGLFTASCIFVLNQDGKKDTFSVAAMTYIMEKVAEVITGECKPQVGGVSLSWGNDNEKDADMWLQKFHPHEYMGKGNFKFFPYNEFSGGSPDGLSDTHVIELKCPYNAANHVQWLLYGSPEWLQKNYPEYYAQIQFNMLCCKRHYALIASYDPRTIEHNHRMKIIEVERDEPYLEKLTTRIDLAVGIVKDCYKKLV